MPRANTISVYTERKDTPIPLCDRFGDWMDESILIGNWHQEPAGKTLTTLRKLAARFPEESDHINIPADPRNFCDEEMCFVAMHNGRIGIHAEFELDFVLGPENDPAAYAKDSDLCPPDVFQRRVMFWREKLASMDALFRHTEFFVAHGDMTYMNRVTLNAFTPLKNGLVGNQTIAAPDEFLMLSPYLPDHDMPSIFECRTIRQVTNALINAGFDDELTGVEAAQKAGNPFALAVSPEVIDRHQRELNAYKIRIHH